MFDDYEVMLDEVYGLSINLTVDDGEYNDSAIIELDLSGANDEGSFRLGNTNLDQTGILPNSSLKRNSFDFNGSYNFIIV